MSTCLGEMMVTVKISYDGKTKRWKIPLRETGASKLEDKLRELLHIPMGTPCRFERYSDSAGAYVILDKYNISVYKQLYRAAKAKSKLKMRATILIPEAEAVESDEGSDEEKQIPHPVTIEDVPEPSEPLPPQVPAIKADEKKPEVEPMPISKPKPETAEPETQHTMAFRPHPFKASDKVMEDFDQALAHLLREKDGLMKDINDRLNPTPGFNLPTNNWESTESRVSLSQAPQPRLIPVPAPATCSRQGSEYRVCCNHCDKTIPDVHYHCTKCDDDDFDLCPSCVGNGVACYGNDHWLIKRFKKDGIFVSNTTESILPKKKPAPAKPSQRTQSAQTAALMMPLNTTPLFTQRTCNCCVGELPELEFLNCTTCEDYDLCIGCFLKDAHGHHPNHGFVPAVKGVEMPSEVKAKLNPGRNQTHHAICDGCDHYIKGIRHKCFECPDWDYCSDCVKRAAITHEGHRFVPIYEPLAEVQAHGLLSHLIHAGIRCDGPLCPNIGCFTYITGVRYKCAVCHDTDFCANCEAAPSNMHNKSHPLIMFKTPVHHVTVSTSGEHGNGRQMPSMGDRHARPATSSRATETIASRQVSMNSVQTVVDVEPTEPRAAKEDESEEQKSPGLTDLGAIYIRDTVTDGTILPINHVFEQTWVLRNTGKVAWPPGCTVKYVGGDYMGHVDSNHPAGISELVSASESTVCYDSLEPENEFPFTVLLRTPSREGKIVSYWRLTAPDGTKFGHRLWCDVTVQTPKTKEDVAAISTDKEEQSQTSSPPISIDEDDKPEAKTSGNEKPKQRQEEEADDFDDCQEWDGSEEGFLTDEEYDILDASDEEYLEEQAKKSSNK